MERLTIHNGMYKRLDPEQAEAIYKKLRAYEDTGLEPEKVEAAKKIAEWFTSLFKDAKEWWNDMVPRNKEGDSMLVEKPTGTIRTAYDSNNDPYLFEATGAEAKRFMDILNADDEGRLLVLPCKVGDTVYAISTYRYSNIVSVSEVSVEAVTLWDDRITVRYTRNINRIDDNGVWGKTVFLTSAEAEKAMEVSEDA